MDPAPRAHIERLLLDITAIPTAAGREHRVADRIADWVDARDDLALRTDRAGNMLIERVEADETRPPLLITAHLDHPAFVVDGMVGESALRLGFRGGVLDPYFREAPIDIITADDRNVPARIVQAGPAQPFRLCVAELETDEPVSARVLRRAMSDDGVWLPPKSRTA